jgi:hypothetical protein
LALRQLSVVPCLRAGPDAFVDKLGIQRRAFPLKTRIEPGRSQFGDLVLGRGVQINRRIEQRTDSGRLLIADIRQISLGNEALVV